DPGQLGDVVADGTVDRVQLVVDELAGALDAAVPGQAGAFEAHAGDLPVLPEDLHGAVPEVQVQSAGDGAAVHIGGLGPFGLAGQIGRASCRARVERSVSEVVCVSNEYHAGYGLRFRSEL